MIKVFIPYKTYETSEGIKVTKYKVNPKIHDKIDLRILAIDIKTGDVDYKKIIEFSKHENVKLYKISSNYFETFWVTEDHSLIVYDSELDVLRKASPKEILQHKARYYLVKRHNTCTFIPHICTEITELVKKLFKQNCILINCKKDVNIEYDPTKNIAYDLTVEDYFTFATENGVFVQDTVGLYFIDTTEGKQEIFDNKMHTIYHIKYLQNDKYIHKLRHELLYGVYILTSAKTNTQKKVLNIESLRDFQINFKYFNDIDKPVYIKDIKRTTTLGRVLLNKVVFNDSFLIDFEITKKNVEVINDLLYNKLKKDNPNLDEYNLNKLYLDKLHELVLFLTDFISYTNYNPTIRKNDYMISDNIINNISKIISEPYIGSVLYDKIVNESVNELVKDSDSDLAKIYLSGSRVSKNQLAQIIAARGFIADDRNIVNNQPIKVNLLQGLSEDELFISSFGARKGLVDKQEQTPKSGYLARTMTMNTSYITCSDNDDCGATNFLTVKIFSIDHAKTLIGRYYYDQETGKLERITKDNYEDLYKKCTSRDEFILLRSPIYCKSEDFTICKKCSGDFEWKNIGLLSGAFITERMTQLILRVFHTSGSANLDIPKELYDIIEPERITKDGCLKLDEKSLEVLRDIFRKKINNDNYEVSIDDNGKITVNGHPINKDIVTTVVKIKSFLTKTISNIEEKRLYPDVVYHSIMKEYLKHGFIKSIFVETVLSNLYVQQEGNKKIPIRYVNDIKWNKVMKLSSKQAGIEFGKFLHLIYEPNRNSLFNIVLSKTENNLVNDIYQRLIIK